MHCSRARQRDHTAVTLLYSGPRPTRPSFPPPAHPSLCRCRGTSVAAPKKHTASDFDGGGLQFPGKVPALPPSIFALAHLPAWYPWRSPGSPGRRWAWLFWPQPLHAPPPPLQRNTHPCSHVLSRPVPWAGPSRRAQRQHCHAAGNSTGEGQSLPFATHHRHHDVHLPRPHATPAHTVCRAQTPLPRSLPLSPPHTTHHHTTAIILTARWRGFPLWLCRGRLLFPLPKPLCSLSPLAGKCQERPL